MLGRSGPRAPPLMTTPHASLVGFSVSAPSKERRGGGRALALGKFRANGATNSLCSYAWVVRTMSETSPTSLTSSTHSLPPPRRPSPVRGLVSVLPALATAGVPHDRSLGGCTFPVLGMQHGPLRGVTMMVEDWAHRDCGCAKLDAHYLPAVTYRRCIPIEQN